MVRSLLFEAANALLTRVQSWNWLKRWGLEVVKRRGKRRAQVAVARKASRHHASDVARRYGFSLVAGRRNTTTTTGGSSSSSSSSKKSSSSSIETRNGRNGGNSGINGSASAECVRQGRGNSVTSPNGRWPRPNNGPRTTQIQRLMHRLLNWPQLAAAPRHRGWGANCGKKNEPCLVRTRPTGMRLGRQSH